MSRNTGKYKKVHFNGEEMRDQRDYYPMTARNFFTNEEQEVVLMAPNIIARLTSVESRPELRADLNRAFRKFTALQQRVLYRVLVQGQSLRVATNGMRKSTPYWHTWFKREAMPKLRRELSDYVEPGKLVLS